MKSKILTTITTLIVIASAICTPLVSALTVKEANCKRLEFIWARGSGQNYGAAEFRAYQTAIESRLALELPSFTYGFYELEYPAVPISPENLTDSITAAGALISSGDSFLYGQSVDTGSRNLIRHISDTKAACPDTFFVIGGYSQGAHVVGDALISLNPQYILYVALFGDPKLHLPEGKTANPPACHGESLSPYRAYVPNCYTSEGILRGRSPYIPAAWDDKVGTWCNARDVICGSSLNLLDHSIDSSGHGEYATNGQMYIAANHIWDRIVSAVHPRELYQSTRPPITTSLTLSNQPPADTVFVIDSSGSMSNYIERYRESALTLAREIITAQGRVALVEYRDYEDTGYPRLLSGFTYDYDQFAAQLNSITAENLSGGDAPEGLLAALKLAYDSLDWRFGASKSAIVLTDAVYHSPDKSGITYAEVVNQSRAIDPVNTYIIARWDYFKYHPWLDLAHDTGGAVFSIWDSLDRTHAKIFSRPTVLFEIQHYHALVDSPIVFDVHRSYSLDASITSYEWDLDADGTYESITDAPFFTHAYDTTGDHLAIVRATDSLGRVSTMSVPVSVYANLEDMPPNPELPPPIPDQPATADQDETTPADPLLVLSPSAPPDFPQSTPPNSPTPSSSPAAPTETITSEPTTPTAPIIALAQPAAGSVFLRWIWWPLAITAIILLWISKQFWSQGGRGILGHIRQWSSSRPATTLSS